MNVFHGLFSGLHMHGVAHAFTGTRKTHAPPTHTHTHVIHGKVFRFLMFLCDMKQISEAICIMLYSGTIGLLCFEMEIGCSLDVKSCVKLFRK